MGLLRGFCKAAERQVLAWRMASSLVVGGVGEEREEWMEREKDFVLSRSVLEGKKERWTWG